MLLTGPEIVGFSVAPANSNLVYIKVTGGSHEDLNFFASSADAGSSFQILAGDKTNEVWSTAFALDQRRYVLAEGFLLRSDDAGKTWTNTAARRFLRKETEAAIKRESTEYIAGVEKRLPYRTPLWHAAFVGFGVVYCAIVMFPRKEETILERLGVALRGASLLFVVWLLLVESSELFHWMANSQYPTRFWNTSVLFNPSSKVAIVMHIANKPIPLLAYLFGLFWILPGSVDSVFALFKRLPATSSRLRSLVSIVATCLFLSFHLLIAFWGSFAG